MSDKLCGLAGLGLDNLEDMDIFGQEKKVSNGCLLEFYGYFCISNQY